VQKTPLLYYLFSILSIGILSLSARADSIVRYDSSFVDVRTFDQAQLDDYRSQPDFQYEPTPIELSWWGRLKRAIWNFFFGGSKAANTFWEIVLYLLAGAAVMIIVFGILKLKPDRFFSRAKSPTTSLDFAELDEDIHEMDFETLIRQAVGEQSYRRGVRLLYLETLKELTENRWIDWKKHKTNQDYQLELAGTPIHPAFDDLTLRYEYVWYGDFPINQQGFSAMEGIFRGFQQRVKRSS
jgi:hypothetical protein